MRFQDIDWQAWEPNQRATLCFVIRGGRILLIHKKRGLGAGKINGPGGRIEAGETALECAVRETREELGVTATGVRQVGLLSFQFTGGLALHGSVFRASDCRGDAVETDEAVPFWCDLDAIPFERMWEDDRLWFPHLLSGRSFEGRFLFDSESDRMLGYELDLA